MPARKNTTSTTKKTTTKTVKSRLRIHYPESSVVWVFAEKCTISDYEKARKSSDHILKAMIGVDNQGLPAYASGGIDHYEEFAIPVEYVESLLECKS